MEAMTSQEEQALRQRAQEIRGRIDGLSEQLRAVDGELDAIAPRRRQHELLDHACGSLEKLGELGAGALFWGERIEPARAAEHLRGVRTRVDAFKSELGELEGRRREVLDRIGEQEGALEVVGEDLYDLREQEERRKLEWVVEREESAVPVREQVMAWARGGEDDRRLRKSLAAALAASLIAGAILPMIDLPLPKQFEPEDVPERLAELVREEQERLLPPPVLQQQVPEEPKPQQRESEPEQVPDERPKPPGPEAPAYAAAQPKGVEKPAGPVGILAFRDRFAGLAKNKSVPELGDASRFRGADDTSSEPAARAMLTSNAPGSSGGINLASLSRNVGGGGGGGGTGAGGGGLQGVQVGRATSSIGGAGGGGGGDRPRAGGGPGLSRTDEEIQIVFDRYKAAFYRLYNRELRKDPTLQGQIVLRLTIEPDGSVSMCEQFASDMDAPQLSAQVVDRVLGINFGAKEGVEALTIVYPIDFLPAA